jgi:hypothetical protein
MGRIPGALCALLAAFGTWGCSELPRSFQTLSLDEVRPLVAAGSVEVVEVLRPGPATVRMYPDAVPWHPSIDGSEPPPLRSRAALVVGSEADAVYRAAAALARADHGPLYVFIPRTPEERQALVALARRGEESSRGEDS